MHNITPLECSRIAQDLQIRKMQVESVVQLLDEGNTVPFITRYRKERTGGLNEEAIRQIQSRVTFLRQLHDRKQTILKTIDLQGKLTAELREAIEKADTTKRLEDLYLPYKPKKRSLAAAAREKGLEPLALAIWHSDPAAAGASTSCSPALVNPERQLGRPTTCGRACSTSSRRWSAETADVRAAVRRVLWETGKIVAAKNEKLGETQGHEYKDYFQFTEPARQIPPHRILALNRGEKEGAIRVKMEWSRRAGTPGGAAALAEHLQQVAGKMPQPPAVPPPEPAAPVPAVDSQMPGEPTATPEFATPQAAEDATPQAAEDATPQATEPATPAARRLQRRKRRRLQHRKRPKRRSSRRSRWWRA